MSHQMDSSANILTLEYDASALISGSRHSLQAVAECIQSVRDDFDVIHFRNGGQPIDMDTPEGPTAGGEEIDQTMRNVLAATDLSIVTYSFLDAGADVRNVIPLHRSERGSQGFAIDFGYHQDNSWLPFIGNNRNNFFMPNYLLFLCVSNMEKVETKIVLASDLLRSIDRAQIAILSHNRIAVPPPPNIVEAGYDITEADVILRSGRKGLEMRFDPAFLREVQGENLRALEAVSDAITEADSVCHEIHWVSGDLAVIDNYRVLHRRRAFAPSPRSERRRWLKRVYAA